MQLTKTRYSAFIQGSSNIERLLRDRGIDTLLVTGTATNVCCESSARDAMMLNFKTIMVTDGNAATDDDDHNASLIADCSATCRRWMKPCNRWSAATRRRRPRSSAALFVGECLAKCCGVPVAFCANDQALRIHLQHVNALGFDLAPGFAARGHGPVCGDTVAAG